MFSRVTPPEDLARNPLDKFGDEGDLTPSQPPSITGEEMYPLPRNRGRLGGGTIRHPKNLRSIFRAVEGEGRQEWHDYWMRSCIR